MDLSFFATADAWVALLTLTLMEIVLGIDNIVFISILADRLPKDQQQKARTLGLSLALIMRVGLLFAISWIMGLKEELFRVPYFEHSVSGRDLILGLGGLFLIGKASHEIYAKLEGPESHGSADAKAHASFRATIAQILLLDIVFSLDSVITAVGMANEIAIMILATMIAVGVMLVFAGSISDFINKHPSMKILALSFLLLIGVVLVADGLHEHINKGYIYFAMAFALGVELVNMRTRKLKAAAAVKLHEQTP